MTTHIYTLRLKSGELYRFTGPTAEFTIEVDDIAVAGGHFQEMDDGQPPAYFLGHYPNGENFQPLQAIVPVPEGKDVKDMSFEELLMASSLGSPDAWALAQSMDPAVRARFDQMLDKKMQPVLQRSIAALHLDEHGFDDGMVDRLGDQENPTQDDLEAMKRYAPWSEDQAKALNAFQHRGNFHPFTCPNTSEHLPQAQHVHLIADELGWICPVKTCTYSQPDWAWAAMFDTANLSPAREWNPRECGFSHPHLYGCSCEVEVLSSNEGAGWRITKADPECKVHPQLPEEYKNFTKADLQDMVISPIYDANHDPASDHFQRMQDELNAKKRLEEAAALDPNSFKLTDPLTNPMVEQEKAAATYPELAEGPFKTKSGKVLTDADIEALADADEVTEEEFDAAMAAGTPVDVEVNLQRKKADDDCTGTGDGDETFDDANPSQS